MSEMANDVVTVLERYRRAVLRKDVEGMMALYADDVRVFDTWGCGSTTVPRRDA